MGSKLHLQKTSPELLKACTAALLPIGVKWCQTLLGVTLVPIIRRMRSPGTCQMPIITIAPHKKF